jgi:hypothetical protein
VTFNHGVVGSIPTALTNEIGAFFSFFRPGRSRSKKRLYVTPVTSRARWKLYTDCRRFSPGSQEVAMTAMKQTGTRFARWFKTFREKNRPPYRYYEHSMYDA